MSACHPGEFHMQDSHLNYGDEYLQFGLKPNPSGQVDAVVEIQWQPTPLAVERLAEAKATEAHLLIVTESQSYEMDRLVVPLEAGRWFVPLATPGLNHIHATIVWSDLPKDRSAKRLLLGKDSRRNYTLSVLDEIQPSVLSLSQQIQSASEQMNTPNISDEQRSTLDEQRSELQAQLREAYNDDYEAVIRSDLFSSYDERKHYRSLGRARVSLVVPEKMFAQSWAITKKLGNLILSDARDQCQLRRRAIITGVTAPIWVPILAAIFTIILACAYLVGALVVIALWVWGSRNLDYDYFKLNNGSKLGDIFADIKPSRWWTKEVKTDQGYGSQSIAYPARHPIFYFLNPVTLVIVTMIVGVQLYFGVDGWSLTIPFLVIAAIGLAIIAVAVIMTRREDALTTEPPADVARQMVVKRYSPTAVQHAKQTPTLHLRYLETKAKFCKPFARRA